MFEDLMTSFLSSSTIHGLVHIASTKRLSRLFWMIVVVTGLMGSLFLIVKSFRGWQESPISTSVEILPITEITFPNVTVCPPRDTFTLLNLDLMMANKIVIDEKTRAELLDTLNETVVMAGYEDTLNDMNNLVEKDRFRNWYEGVSKILMPYWNSYKQQKFHKLETLAVSGEVVTPFLGEAWDDDKFEAALVSRVLVSRPWTEDSEASLEVRIHQDMITEIGSSSFGSTSGDFDLSFVGGSFLDRAKTNLTFILTEKENYIGLKRKISEAAVQTIKREKIPGIRISWQWNNTSNINPDRNFLNENRNFIKIANIVHQIHPDTHQLWQFFKERRNQLVELSSCANNMYKFSIIVENQIEKIIGDFVSYNSSNNSTPVSELSEAELRTASDLYLYLIYCPTWTDRSKQLIELYSELFQNYDARSIILTVAKIVTHNVEESNVFEYQLAKNIFEKVWSMFDLKSKLISKLTTSMSALKGNVLMEDLYQNVTNCPDCGLSSIQMSVDKSVAALLNHPVHLIDGAGKLSLSSFIPYCEFGGDPHTMGQIIAGFDLPVCTSFREKIHNGQLCYGLDVNKLKVKGSFRPEDLRIGLSFLLDYNSERALRKYQKQNPETTGSISKGILHSGTEEEALIHLDTLSKSLIHYNNIDYQNDIETTR